jgi:hypothetical protein
VARSGRERPPPYFSTAMSSPDSTPDAQHSALYQQLLGETAKIDWKELERFFAQGKLLAVAHGLDLVAVAEAIAGDDQARVGAWLESGQLERMQAATASDYAARSPELWAVVVSPWVCVQERAAAH